MEEEIEIVKIDLEKLLAAAQAGHPIARQIVFETVQEYYETTGKLMPGVRMNVRFELNDDALVPFALDGDREPLISYIEKGGDINRDDIRSFILDVLRGKRPPKRRPRRAATFLHHAVIAWHVRKWRAAGLGPEAAIKQAIQAFDVDRTTVQRALKDCAD